MIKNLRVLALLQCASFWLIKMDFFWVKIASRVSLRP
jgi:hypothetical protein